MTQRRRYHLSAFQELKLIEARQKVVDLVESPLPGQIDINSFTTNTEEHRLAQKIVESIEHLLGY